MRICLLVILSFLFAVSAATTVRAADITLDIARSGTTTAILDVDVMPNGPEYVLAVLPFALNAQAVIIPEADPKDLAFIVSREPQGVIAITGFTGTGRYTIRNAIRGVDADRFKIRLAKRSNSYENLVTMAATAGPLIDNVDKAILDWTIQIDLPEGFEDLKPARLAPVNNRLTLTPGDLAQELIVDFKNPALEVTSISTTFGAVITLIFTLLIGLGASYGVWERRPTLCTACSSWPSS